MPIKHLYIVLDTVFDEIYSPTHYWLNNWHEDNTQAQSKQFSVLY